MLYAAWLPGDARASRNMFPGYSQRTPALRHLSFHGKMRAACYVSVGWPRKIIYKMLPASRYRNRERAEQEFKNTLLFCMHLRLWQIFYLRKLFIIQKAVFYCPCCFCFCLSFISLMSIFLFCLSVCLPVCLSVCLSVCLQTPQRSRIRKYTHHTLIAEAWSSLWNSRDTLWTPSFSITQNISKMPSPPPLQRYWNVEP